MLQPSLFVWKRHLLNLCYGYVLKVLVAAEKLLIDPLVRLRYLIFPFGELRVIEWSDMIDKILDAFVFVVINKKCTVHIIIILSGFAEHIE